MLDGLRLKETLRHGIPTNPKRAWSVSIVETRNIKSAFKIFLTLWHFNSSRRELNRSIETAARTLAAHPNNLPRAGLVYLYPGLNKMVIFRKVDAHSHLDRPQPYVRPAMASVCWLRTRAKF